MPSDKVLVIGGGPAGLEASWSLADLGLPVILVEQLAQLGGTPISANYATFTPDLRPAEEVMREMIGRVEGRPEVGIHLQSRVVACQGSAGQFGVTIAGDGKELKETVGSIIVATGFTHFDPGRETQLYGYYEFDDVITLQEAEAMLKRHHFVRPSTGQPPERVAFIQCVGSRDRHIGNEYCSKVCCGIASKEAIEIRQQLPECRVFIFYIDMRMYGYWENAIYWPAQEKYKVNYVRGVATEILKKGDKLLLRGEDTTMGRPMEVPMDVVVLSVGMEPSAGTREIAKTLGLPQNKYRFIDTVGGVMDTVSTAREGVYVAGAAAGPMDLEDSVSMAGAAAVKAAITIRRAARQPV